VLSIEFLASRFMGSHANRTDANPISSGCVEKVDRWPDQTTLRAATSERFGALGKSVDFVACGCFVTEARRRVLF
jgi:hypothetical protein